MIFDLSLNCSVTSIKKNTCFREFTPRAMQRRLPLVATLRGSRDLRGAKMPSNGARCSADPNGARVKLHVLSIPTPPRTQCTNSYRWEEHPDSHLTLPPAVEQAFAMIIAGIGFYKKYCFFRKYEKLCVKPWLTFSELRQI